MTFIAADPVASGRPYDIVAIGAGAPRNLEQFAGESRFTIDGDGGESTICGYGAAGDDGEVKFHEKDLATGKDVRTWHIHRSTEGLFTAVPTAASCQSSP